MRRMPQCCSQRGADQRRWMVPLHQSMKTDHLKEPGNIEKQGGSRNSIE